MRAALGARELVGERFGARGGRAVLGISNTAVTPPSAAARVPVSRSSLCSLPGSRKCTCVSITPGSTCRPLASNTSPALACRKIADGGDLAVAHADIARPLAGMADDGSAAHDQIVSAHRKPPACSISSAAASTASMLTSSIAAPASSAALARTRAPRSVRARGPYGRAHAFVGGAEQGQRRRAGGGGDVGERVVVADARAWRAPSRRAAASRSSASPRSRAGTPSASRLATIAAVIVGVARGRAHDGDARAFERRRPPAGAPPRRSARSGQRLAALRPARREHQQAARHRAHGSGRRARFSSSQSTGASARSAPQRLGPFLGAVAQHRRRRQARCGAWLARSRPASRPPRVDHHIEARPAQPREQRKAPRRSGRQPDPRRGRGAKQGRGLQPAPK